MTGTDTPWRDGQLDVHYRIGYATELIRQFIAHYDRGDEAALAHSVEVARRFLTEEDAR